jgi:DNA-binding winged helix-turn-helix (wHTH) protein
VAVTRRELLTEVWGDGDRDEHVVEVTVRRLRRQLGPCADVIVAVPRRGFQFNGHLAA